MNAPRSNSKPAHSTRKSPISKTCSFPVRGKQKINSPSFFVSRKAKPKRRGCYVRLGRNLLKRAKSTKICLRRWVRIRKRRRTISLPLLQALKTTLWSALRLMSKSDGLLPHYPHLSLESDNSSCRQSKSTIV